MISIQIGLALAYELALQMNNSRRDYVEFIDAYNLQRVEMGLPEEDYGYDHNNWRYILGMRPDYGLEEYKEGDVVFDEILDRATAEQVRTVYGTLTCTVDFETHLSCSI